MKKLLPLFLALIFAMAAHFPANASQNQEKENTELAFIGKKSTDLGGKARVILRVVKIDFLDSSGFQMLLDADANTYGDVFKGTGDFTTNGNAGIGVYDEFETKIPSNADGALTTRNMVHGRADSVDITPGTYDYVITHPSVYDNRIKIPQGKYARYNNFEFEADYTYEFYITSVTDGSRSGIVTPKFPFDAALNNLFLPISGHDLNNAEEITVSIRNCSGREYLTNFDVYYQVDNGTPVKESCVWNLAPESDSLYTFSTKADFSATKSYQVKAWVSLSKDVVASNDTVLASCTKKTPLNLPFEDDFSTKSTFSENWVVYDADRDGVSWGNYFYNNANYGDADGNSYGGIANIAYSNTNMLDDYLITAPLNMAVGDNHLSFYFNTGLNTYAVTHEHLQVFFGNTANPAEMEMLADLDNLTLTTWQLYVLNVNVKTAGAYYFAFRARSLPMQTSIGIDNVKVDAGLFPGSPDLAMHQLLMPNSACDLTTGQIGVIFKNEGSEPINGFSLTYEINNGDTTITKTKNYNDTIGLLETVEYMIDDVLDFSEVKDYQVRITGSCSRDSISTNNSISRKLIHYSPITTYPYRSDLSDPTELANWTMTDRNSWAYMQEAGLLYPEVDSVNRVLTTRCLHMEPGAYLIGFNYTCGIDYVVLIEDSLRVTYGKVGTDMADWDSLVYFDNFYSVGAKDYERMILIEEEGDYVFAFNALTTHYISIASFEVDKMLDHDMRISRMSSTMGFGIPADVVNGTQHLTVYVENRGSNKVEGGKVVVTDEKDQKLGESQSFELAITEKKEISFPITVSGIQSHSNLKITAAVSMTASDLNPSDNSLENVIAVSDSLFRLDNVTTFGLNGQGSNYEESELGMIFHLASGDTLTGVIIGGVDVPARPSTFFAVYKMNADMSVGEQILQESVRISGYAGFQRFIFDSIHLEAGDYFMSMIQRNETHMGLAFDSDPSGYFYKKEAGNIRKISAYGNLAIRPLFEINGIGTDLKAGANKQSRLTAYPNPASNYISFAAAAPIQQLEIFNLMGSQLYSNNGINSDLFEFDLSGFAKGIYFARVKCNDSTELIKFIVQ